MTAVPYPISAKWNHLACWQRAVSTSDLGGNRSIYINTDKQDKLIELSSKWAEVKQLTMDVFGASMFEKQQPRFFQSPSSPSSFVESCSSTINDYSLLFNDDNDKTQLTKQSLETELKKMVSEAVEQHKEDQKTQAIPPPPKAEVTEISIEAKLESIVQQKLQEELSKNDKKIHEQKELMMKLVQDKLQEMDVKYSKAFTATQNNYVPRDVMRMEFTKFKEVIQKQCESIVNQFDQPFDHPSISPTNIQMDNTQASIERLSDGQSNEQVSVGLVECSTSNGKDPLPLPSPLPVDSPMSPHLVIDETFEVISQVSRSSSLESVHVAPPEPTPSHVDVPSNRTVTKRPVPVEIPSNGTVPKKPVPVDAPSNVTVPKSPAPVEVPQKIKRKRLSSQDASSSSVSKTVESRASKDSCAPPVARANAPCPLPLDELLPPIVTDNSKKSRSQNETSLDRRKSTSSIGRDEPSSRSTDSLLSPISSCSPDTSVTIKQEPEDEDDTLPSPNKMDKKTFLSSFRINKIKPHNEEPTKAAAKPSDPRPSDPKPSSDLQPSFRPKLIKCAFSALIPERCAKMSKEELIQDIARQNSFLKDPTSNGLDLFLYVTSTRATIAYISLTKENYKAIVDNSLRLQIGPYVCALREQDTFMQCYNCQKFGHRTHDCTGPVRCVHCSLSHHVRSSGEAGCTVEKPLCANCYEENRRRRDASLFTDHRADDPECPCFKRAKKAAANKKQSLFRNHG